MKKRFLDPAEQLTWEEYLILAQTVRRSAVPPIVVFGNITWDMSLIRWTLTPTPSCFSVTETPLLHILRWELFVLRTGDIDTAIQGSKTITCPLLHRNRFTPQVAQQLVCALTCVNSRTYEAVIIHLDEDVHPMAGFIMVYYAQWRPLSTTRYRRIGLLPT